MNAYICRDNYHLNGFLGRLLFLFLFGLTCVGSGLYFYNYLFATFGALACIGSVYGLRYFFSRRYVEVIFDSTSIGYLENGTLKYNVPVDDIKSVKFYRDAYIIKTMDGETITEDDLLNFDAKSALSVMKELLHDGAIDKTKYSFNSS